jgi:hypothetical protein
VDLWPFSLSINLQFGYARNIIGADLHAAEPAETIDHDRLSDIAWRCDTER